MVPRNQKESIYFVFVHKLGRCTNHGIDNWIIDPLPMKKISFILSFVKGAFILSYVKGGAFKKMG